MKKINLDNIFNITFTSYQFLIDFFKSYPKQWYDENNFYCEEHHIIPKFDNGTNKKENLIYLPFKYHFLAHYYQAQELEQIDKIKSNKHYAAAFMILHQKNISKTDLLEFENNIPQEIYAVKQQYILNSIEWGKNLKGKKRSEETRKRLSESKKGEKNPLYKKHRSLESRLKQSKTRTGKPHPHRKLYTEEELKQRHLQRLENRKQHRKLLYHLNKNLTKVVCIETNEIFNSIADAQRKYHCSNISRVCNNGKRAGSYHWQYYSSIDNSSSNNGNSEKVLGSNNIV